MTMIAQCLNAPPTFTYSAHGYLKDLYGPCGGSHDAKLIFTITPTTRKRCEDLKLNGWSVTTVHWIFRDSFIDQNPRWDCIICYALKISVHTTCTKEHFPWIGNRLRSFSTRNSNSGRELIINLPEKSLRSQSSWRPSYGDLPQPIWDKCKYSLWGQHWHQELSEGTLKQLFPWIPLFCILTLLRSNRSARTPGIRTRKASSLDIALHKSQKRLIQEQACDIVRNQNEIVEALV